MPILKEIIKWIEDKPMFWQEAVNRIIRNKILTPNDINDLVEICKYEQGISEYEFQKTNLAEIKELIQSSDEIENITLVKIKNNENINALKDNSELSFMNSGLTGIYGDNGSGKSSYVSILKNTCNTRGIQPRINFNLFNPDSNTKRQIAQVEYLKESGDSGEVTWEDGVLDGTILKAVDVFDSMSANHYVDGEDEIAFIPSGLAVLEKLASACNQVESIISSEKEISNRISYDYSFLLDDVETEVSQFLRGLNDKTKQEDLNNLSTYSKEDDLRIKGLSEAIFKLKATDPLKEIEENNKRIRRFNSLKLKYKTLESNFSQTKLDTIKDTLNNLVIISEASKTASEKAFSNLPIKGVGNDQWKKLWESARKFYDGIQGEEAFPNTDDGESCPLCLQELGEEAQNRFVNFEGFVKADLQEQLNQAEASLKIIVNLYKELIFDLTENEPTIDEINELVADFKVAQESFIRILEEKRNSVLTLIKNSKKVTSISTVEFVKNPITIIETLVLGFEKHNVQLSKASIEKELKVLENEYANVIAVKNLTTYKIQIEKEISRKKRSVKLNKCSSQCNTRNITLLSNSLTETYVTGSLKNNFKEELKKLGFKNIKVSMETKGARGRQYHYLQLDTSYGVSVNLKDVLSEGEHRCISLATFLSELSISEHKSAVIFDDPVSSLDHKWRSKIANRIVQEALKRQVIVFTHDITFLMMLQEEVKKLACNFEIKSLTRKKTETGIIASNPPWDALPISKRIGVLKDTYQNLEKIERTETEEKFREAVKPFYGKLRETWERLVEELALNGTVQRFGREIQTKKLKKVVNFTDDDYKIIEDNMSKCSGILDGHDGAGALIDTVPDSDEVNDDIKIIEDFSKLLRRRNN